MAESKNEPTKAPNPFRYERTCEKYTPLYFAAAAGDFHPVHVDPEVGEAAGFGGAILQSLCTMAWAAEAVHAYTGDPRKLKRLKVRFAKPVRADDTVTFDGSVVKTEGGRLHAQMTAVNQRGDAVLSDVVVEAEL